MSNDFKPFAFSATARVLSQVSWLTDTSLVNGFPTGILTKERLNKALRQPSAIAAAVAEVVGNRIGEDVLDDGDFAKLVRQIDDAFGTAGGGGGTQTPTLKLRTTGIAFIFPSPTSNVSTSPTITFTGELSGSTGTVTFLAVAKDAAGATLGTIALGGLSPVATLTAAQFTTYAGTQYVVVTASHTTTTGAVLQDTETIFRANDGDNTIQVRLSNATTTVPALADGTVTSYANASGTIAAAKGASLLGSATSPSVSYSLVGYTGFSTSYPAAQAGISLNPTSGAYAVTGGMVADSASVTFRATFTGGYAPIDIIFTISKAKKGDPGPSGTSPSVDINFSHLAFVTLPNSTTPQPSAGISCTAVYYNLPSPTFEWKVDGVLQASTSSVFVLPPFSPSTSPFKMVEVKVTGSDSSVATDAQAVYSLQNGSDAIYAAVDNQSWTIPCDETGAPVGVLPIVASINTVRGTQLLIGPADGVTYSLTGSSGFSGMSLSVDGDILITGITDDTAWASYSVTVGGISYPAGTLRAVKSKNGAPGGEAIVDRLTNSNVTLAALTDGTVTSYATAFGQFVVQKGALQLSSSTSPAVSFSLVGYTGFSTSYPAVQAGISLNPSTGEYAVTGGMTNDMATVTLRATITGNGSRDQVFTLTKSRQGAGSVSFLLSPRSEAVLPVDGDGNILSYADANTTAKVLDNGADVTGAWTLSRTDYGVDSNLVGNVLTVTSLYGPGTLDAASSNAAPVGHDWEAVYSGVYGNGVYVLFGRNQAAGTWSKIGVTSDFTTVQYKNATVAGTWQFGAFSAGVFLSWEIGAFSNKLQRSTDNGQTWVAATLPETVQWHSCQGGDTAFIISKTGAAEGYRSATGATGTWTLIALPSATFVLVPVGGTVWLGATGMGVWHISFDNGTTWALLSTHFTLGGSDAVGAAIRYKGKILIFIANGSGAAYVKLSDNNGATWRNVSLPAGCSSFRSVRIIKGVLFVANTNASTDTFFYTTDGVVFKKASSEFTTTINFQGLTSWSQDIQNALFAELNVASGLMVRIPIKSVSGQEGYVSLSAAKSGQTTLNVIFPVRKGPTLPDVYVGSLFPALVQLPSTADGVVTNYGPGAITVGINKNGINDTSNWAITWVSLDAGLVLSGSTGATNSIVSMATALDSAIIRITAKKAGQQDFTADLSVTKNKTGTTSGPPGVISPLFTDQSQLTLRIKRDGRVQVKRGSAGAFTDFGSWFFPNSATVGDGWWGRVVATGDALASNDLATIQNLNTDRDLVLSRSTSGTSRTDLQVFLSNNSGGTGATLVYGTMQITLP